MITVSYYHIVMTLFAPCLLSISRCHMYSPRHRGSCPVQSEKGERGGGREWAGGGEEGGGGGRRRGGKGGTKASRLKT